MSMFSFDHPQAAKIHIQDRAQAILLHHNGARRKVALVGYASSSRDLAPYDDPEWEVWGVNQLYRFIPRADRWFEIHSNWREEGTSGVVPVAEYEQWLKQCSIPIYMQDFDPSIPHSVRYPKERYVAAFGDYRTSTIAYMLGLAILEEFETIGLYGIELQVGTEYFHQRMCVEYLIGIAKGRGIRIVLPDNCTLLHQAYPYGEITPSSHFPIRYDEIKKRLADHRKKRDDTRDALLTWEAAIAELEYWERVCRQRTSNEFPLMGSDAHG